jgi:putative ABC transport system ATP-binding protein
MTGEARMAMAAGAASGGGAADAPALEVRELVKTFGEGASAVEAVRAVSFTAQAGELVALVGPSGSGKSTLLAMIGALLTPTSGRVLVQGRDIGQMSGGERARFRRDYIGFVFQSSNVIPYLTARENLLLVGEFGGLDRRIVRERADALIGELGLEEAASRLGSRLSGGQRQRVAIARALVRDPALILVDEPTANLDTTRGLQVVEALRDEIRNRGKLGLMVTHDLEMASRANRVLEIRDGQVREHAAPPASPR